MLAPRLQRDELCWRRRRKPLGTYLLILFYILLFLPTYAIADVFEGVIEIKIAQTGLPNLGITYFVKPGWQRTEMPASSRGKVTIIRNLDSGIRYIVNHAAKSYIVMTGSRSMSGRPHKEDFSTAIKTGEQKKFHGYLCDLWEKKIKNGNTLSVWTTTELEPITAIDNNTKMRAGNLKGVPLLIVERSRDGKPFFRWEVTRLEKQKLSELHFAPPIRIPENRYA